MENIKQQNLHKAKQISQFPIKQQQRGCTDVFCMIIAILFGLSIIITSIIVFNNDHYNRTSFPSDSQGRVCGYDLKSHPYIYFTKLPQTSSRVCVQSCPKKEDKQLKCVPTDNIGCIFSNNPNFTVTYYENTQQELEIGSFCAPKEQSIRQKLYQDIGVTSRYNFFKQIKSIIICGFISIGLAILYLCSVQWFPKIMNLLSVILGLIFVLFLSFLIIFYPSQNTAAKIIFSIIIILLILIVAFGAFKSKGCFDMHGIFLKYATQLLKQNIKILIYIPIFLTAFTLFILITIWELKSLWSSAGIHFTSESVYYSFNPNSTTIYTILVFIQFIWGLSFIKQSFNFCISGNAVQWYHKQNQQVSIHLTTFKPFIYIFQYHFGSIAAGSFINIVFSLFDYIFDVLRDDTNTQDQNRNRCLSALDSMFDLVRSDSMAYINLSGNPYCNSSRYCQILCRRSPIAEYSQSISRSYRICSHFLLAGLITIISFFLQGSSASIFIVFIVFILSLFLSTFFISLHADAGQAIQINFLLDLQLAKHKKQKRSNDEIINLDLKNNKVGRQYYDEFKKLQQKINKININN